MGEKPLTRRQLELHAKFMQALYEETYDQYYDCYQMREYLYLLIEIQNFIKEPVDWFKSLRRNIKLLNVEFLKWFLEHAYDELKRRLSFKELLQLESKYNLAKVLNKNFNSLKELNNII